MKVKSLIIKTIKTVVCGRDRSIKQFPYEDSITQDQTHHGRLPKTGMNVMTRSKGGGWFKAAEVNAFLVVKEVNAFLILVG